MSRANVRSLEIHGGHTKYSETLVSYPRACHNGSIMSPPYLEKNRLALTFYMILKHRLASSHPSFSGSRETKRKYLIYKDYFRAPYGTTSSTPGAKSLILHSILAPKLVLIGDYIRHMTTKFLLYIKGLRRPLYSFEKHCIIAVLKVRFG